MGRSASSLRTDHRKRRLSEAERRAAELDAALGAIPDGLLIYDSHGELVRMNPPAERILGFSAEDWAVMTPEERTRAAEVRHADGSPMAVDETPRARALRGQVISREEVIVRRPNGESRRILISSAPIRWAGGEIVGTVMNFNDITELAELREKSRGQAEETRRAFEAISEALIVYGPDGRILRANDIARQYMGAQYDEWERLPHPDRNLVLELETNSGEPVSGESSPLSRALKGETVRGFPMRIRLRDGRRVHMISTTAPIYGPDGSVAGAVATYSDVTQLVELLSLRDEIASVVAHDLRQPLSAIQTNAESLAARLREGRTDAAADLTGWILRGAARMNAIIQDLVDGIRLDAGRLTLNLRPVDLRAEMAELVARTLAPVETARVRVDVEPGLPPVPADPDRLDRMILNLLTNALKYSDPETPVDLRARRRGDEAVIEVRDRGAGIDPDEIPRIFERFYRSSRPERKEGLGLGLYICRALAEAHGGRIWVESDPGRGSAFFVALPLEANDAAG